MPGPFTTTQLSFLAFVYAGVFAILAETVDGAAIDAIFIGCLVLLALYTVLCTPAVVFLAQAELGESGEQ